MAMPTAQHLARMLHARRECAVLLDRALSYSHDFRKPAQIEYYQEQIRYLNARMNGHEVSAPKLTQAQRLNWDCTNVVLEARALAKRGRF